MAPKGIETALVFPGQGLGLGFSLYAPKGAWGSGGCFDGPGRFNCREYLASPTVFLEAFAERNPKTMPDGQVPKQIVSTIGSQK